MAESNYSYFRFSYEKTGKYESPMKGSPLYQNKGSVFIDSLLVEAILTHTSLNSFWVSEDGMFSANETSKTGAHMYFGSVGVRWFDCLCHEE